VYRVLEAFLLNATLIFMLIIIIIIIIIRDKGVVGRVYARRDRLFPPSHSESSGFPFQGNF